VTPSNSACPTDAFDSRTGWALERVLLAAAGTLVLTRAFDLQRGVT